jgi:DNA-directed RNA polymerase subunit M/transcription elongation factor TFIIS
LKRVKKKTYKLNELVYLPNEILNPSALAEERDKVNERLQQKVENKVSTKYTCPMCRHKETTFETRQTAAADESPTICITCLVCKHKWHIRN